MAEAAARDLPQLPLEDALQLVHLSGERGSPKYERAAMRWLERYLTENEPRLQHFAEIASRRARAGRSPDELVAAPAADSASDPPRRAENGSPA
jgi:hypothetical protein